MSYSNGKITAPVSIYDVQRAIGASSPDLGTLCKHSSINKWAKYKPIALVTIDTVTGQWSASQNAWLAAATWWKGGDGHCGLTFSTFNTISSSFLSQLMAGSLQWVYNRPTGGSSQPFRLQDFAQYFHEAVEPVGALAGAGRTIYVPPSGSGMRTLTLNYDAPAAGDLNLTLADFGHGGVSFVNYYLGVVLWKSSSNYRVVTSQNKIGTTGSTLIECEIGYSDIGTWQVMPFLSSIRIDAYSGGQAGTFLSAGYASPDTIIIASSGTVFMINASGSWSNRAYTQVGLNVVVENNSSASKTFTGGLTVYIYETPDSATSGAGGTLVGSWTYSTSFTVAANSTYTIPENLYNSLLDTYFCGYINNLTRQNGKEYWVTARFTDGTSIDNQYEPVQDEIMPE